MNGAPIPADATPLSLVNQSIALLQHAKAKLEPQTGLSPVTQFVQFIKHFGDNPLKNTLKFLALVLLIAGFVLFVLFLARQQERKELLRRESQSYVAQTQALDNVKTSLNGLLEFVQEQKDKLQESEDIVSSLRSEQEKLKPLVETDRKVIDAILDLQYQRTQSDVWRERGMGFGIGVISSVIASFLYGFLRRPRLKKSPGEAGEK